MLTFPDIAPPVYPIREVIKDTSIKGELENQIILTRKRFTKTPKIFEVTWTALSDDDYNDLRNFYILCNGALSFFWNYPEGMGGDYEGKTFLVRFGGDFEFSASNFKRWQGTIRLVEV